MASIVRLNAFKILRVLSLELALSVYWALCVYLRRKDEKAFSCAKRKRKQKYPLPRCQAHAWWFATVAQTFNAAETSSAHVCPADRGGNGSKLPDRGWCQRGQGARLLCVFCAGGQPPTQKSLILLSPPHHPITPSSPCTHWRRRCLRETHCFKSGKS